MTTIERTKNGYSAATGLDISKIDPASHSKYSPNLYAFLKAKKNQSQLRLARVFVDDDGSQYLGFMDDTSSLIGVRLGQVLSYGAKAQVFSYCNTKTLREHVGFWDEYIADGRCAVDREHKLPFIGSEYRWSVVGDRRDCLWCGKASQTRHRHVEQVVVESWQSDTAAK